MMRGRNLLALTACCAAAGALPPLRLEKRADGSRRLVAAIPAKVNAGSAAHNNSHVREANNECSAVVSPRGVCAVVKGPPWLPMEKFQPDASLGPVDLAWLRTAGINVIRLGVMWPGVMPEAPEDGTYRVNTTYIELVKRLVSQAADFGIYTIVEFHQDTLSENFCGDGIPLWVAAELRELFRRDFPDDVVGLVKAMVPYVPVFGDLLDEAVRDFIKDRVDMALFPAPLSEPYELNYSLDPSGMVTRQSCRKVPGGYLRWTDYQTSFEAGHAYKAIFNISTTIFAHFQRYWEVLAVAFKGDPNVMGFELFNEPWPGSFYTEPWAMVPVNFAQRLQPFHHRLAESIHSLDPGRLIIFMPPTIEEGLGIAPMIDQQIKSHVCSGLAHVFSGLLQPLVDLCATLWDVDRWIPKQGMDHTAFTEVPLQNQSIIAPHFYMPPQGKPALYAEMRRQDESRLGVATILGETCCTHDGEGGGFMNGFAAFLPTLYWFERSQAGWIEWEYKQQSIDYSAPVGVPNPAPSQYGVFGARKTGTGPDMFSGEEPLVDRWRLIAHPSAQFVHGEVLENFFEYWHGVFKLTFIPSRCNGDTAWDALVTWPGDWWSGSAWIPGRGFSVSAASPSIVVSPPRAATVTEVHRSEKLQFGRAMPQVRIFGVRALTNDAVTVLLKMSDFQYATAPPEGVVRPPPLHWWDGLAWLVVPCLFFGLCTGLTLIVLNACCRRRCSGCSRRSGTEFGKPLLHDSASV